MTAPPITIHDIEELSKALPPLRDDVGLAGLLWDFPEHSASVLCLGDRLLAATRAGKLTFSIAVFYRDKSKKSAFRVSIHSNGPRAECESESFADAVVGAAIKWVRGTER